MFVWLINLFLQPIKWQKIHSHSFLETKAYIFKLLKQQSKLLKINMTTDRQKQEILMSIELEISDY